MEIVDDTSILNETAATPREFRLPGLAVISSLALVSNGEQQNGVVLRFVRVERDIAGAPLRNHEFAQASLRLPAYQGVAREDVNGFANQVQCFQCAGAAFREKVADPFKVAERLVGITYSRHDLVRGLLICLSAIRWRR